MEEFQEPDPEIMALKNLATLHSQIHRKLSIIDNRNANKKISGAVVSSNGIPNKIRRI